MTEEINPALSGAPAESVAIGNIRERFAIAFAVYGGELDEAGRIAAAMALSRQSPVDAVVALYDALAADCGDGSPRWQSLGPVLLSRAIEAADLIVASLWHGKAGEAAAFATEARQALANMSPAS